ncbi:valine--tRNA ligase [Candidatus Woesearchaeota archaeon]|nr:MAG: valine--tRNA ligase [Candidatus Woesearchaeota archaeon]
MELPKYYNAKEAEKKWQSFWEKEKIYRFDPDSDKPVYSIDVPPPYASAGHLHIGHALHYTQFEIIARYKRMAGFNVHFAPCFDNNGLPTEKYVEEKHKVSKNTISKAEFRKLCLEESRKVEKEYSDKVFRTLGHSYDWSLLYTTIDPEAQQVSQHSFVDLYKKGMVYRAEEPTLWCPHHQTALAQAEIENVDRSTVLNDITFDLEDGGKITIATTRPEFLPACVGIFIHPDDKRNKHLVGKKVIVPIFGHKVKVFTDETVDMDFGSGIMMVCTFGDNADIEKWKKHNLDLKICITRDGKMNELAGKYEGLTLNEAKEKILEDLKAEGRVTKQEKLQQTVGTCWRCNTPVEFIVTKQWFIKTLEHKDALIRQGRKIRWFPEFYRKRYEDWTNNLAWNWCISRQRFYGVPIPVWYCKKCDETIVADFEQLPVDPEKDKPRKSCKCGSKEFVPEEDVFDTWMTSSMSPEIAVRWLKKPESFKKMFPTSLRPQSHDIIRTWAFYTILKAYLHFNEIPWKDIAIGTFVLDPKGRGMHKSKGNAIWTHELLDKYNVDVVRYWVGTATWGEDLPFQEKDLVAGQRFLTKLWNASKFVIMNVKGFSKKDKEELEVIDKWLLSKLSRLVKQTTEFFDAYRTSEAKKAAEQFFWHVFCDNYLEIVKHRLYENKKGSKAAKHTLYQALLTILKLFSPIVPHITEEIYQLFFREYEKEKSIHVSEWPKEGEADEKALETGDKAVAIISAVRRHKSENNMSLKTPIKELVIECDKKTEAELNKTIDDIKGATNAEKISFGKADKEVFEGIKIKVSF